MWLAQHLLENYGRDPRITHGCSTRRPSPAAAEQPRRLEPVPAHRQANRSSVRPVDNDGDGLFDEDENDDLDGDGVIHTMRWRPTMTGVDTRGRTWCSTSGTRAAG
jgi:hypothetical protein